MTEGPPNPDEPGENERGENERIGSGAGRSFRAGESVRTSERLRALAHGRRRAILNLLRENEVMELEDLVERIAARELDGASEESDDEVRRKIRIDLHHAQLPRLEEAGMISYDHRSGTLRYRGCPPVERLLDSCLSTEDADT